MILTQHFQCIIETIIEFALIVFCKPALQDLMIFVDIFTLKFSSYNMGNFRLSCGIFNSVLKTNQSFRHFYAQAILIFFLRVLKKFLGCL